MGDVPVRGADAIAMLARFGPPGADAAMAAAVAPDDEFTSLQDLSRACPPARAGLRPGAFAALLAPLFGEFE